jgi:hypothetical protein
MICLKGPKTDDGRPNLKILAPLLYFLYGNINLVHFIN